LIQAQLNEIPKVIVKVVEQAGQQVVYEEEGEVEVVCREGSMLAREAVLWVEPTTA
jgi:hypothetical protein